MSEFAPSDPITEESLQAIGIEDAARASRAISDLAGQGVSDDDLSPLLPLLLDALRGSPDPDRALHSFSRWFASVGSRYSHLQTLLRHPVSLELFCLVTGSSQYFADLLARQPEYFEILSNPGVRGGTKSAARLYRDVSALVDVCRQPDLKRDALRRWKAREMLRIGVRDLAGLADMPATAREFSNLADACVQKAHDIALSLLPLGPAGANRPPIPFAVIAMGKLGGQELNYSSDIDLMFVHGDSLPAEVEMAEGRRVEGGTYIGRLAEAIVNVLAEESANGHVFRVDMRLRPEGRFGALTRSLSSFQAYYENWAESWERQALLKARFVAGDRALGEAFMAMIEPFVYRRHVSAAFLEDIRANKRRIEQKCALEDQTRTNIKTGYGGIRDIEFTVQLLQLEHGGSQPRLRTPNTLAAIQRLHRARLLSDAGARELAEDYQFLRTLEHRLQLLHGFQTQTLPPSTDTGERLRLARRMGFVAADAFEAALDSRRERVHRHLEHLFYHRAGDSEAPSPVERSLGAWADIGELLDNLESPTVQERLRVRLEAAGFRDIPAALRALHLPMRGNEFGEMPPDTPLEFKAIAPRLFDLLAHSADPDAGLAGIEALALAVPNRAQLYAAFDDSPQVMQRLVQLAVASPPLLKKLARHLEWLEGLLTTEEETGDFGEELMARLQGIAPFEARLDSLALYYQRQILRIGARDAWEEAEAPGTMADLTRLAEAVLLGLLQVCSEPLIAQHAEPEFARRVLDRVAVIGLGKLGGAELGYSSDWDVLFVYGEARGAAARSAERFALVQTLVERVIAAGKALAPRGAAIEIDLRLRPWGRKGALIYSPRGLLDYYRTAGETWERQATLKARFVAGSPAVGRRFQRILHAISYGRGITEAEDAAIRAMKQRIETERLKSSERETDLKLGYGGLSDIEWLAQRLQLQHGPGNNSLRVPNTLRALSALASARLLDNAEADALIHTYSLLTRLRNAIYLRSGTAQDTLPADPAERRILARLLGYLDTGAETAEARLWEDVHGQMQEARRIFLRQFHDN